MNRGKQAAKDEAETEVSDDLRHVDLLRGALSELHDTKDGFNNALFDSMATCVRECAASSSTSPWASVQVTETDMVLERKDIGAVDGFEYATGLARKATISSEKRCCIYEASDEDDEDGDGDSSNNTTRLPNSHVWVVYRRRIAGAGVRNDDGVL